MQEVSLEDYTRHEHLLAYNKIVREFYAYLEQTIGDQPAHTIVGGKVFPILRQEIISAIPITYVPKQECSFFNKVNNTPSGFPTFKGYARTSVITPSLPPL